ncbi:MAG: carbohydrate binding family 9 domain-containing protein [Pyrinomonadaceae bacterium]|nr:carbohydrate binding family 9 domain-containing protein [Pyrinomonadaceae bacterium]
MPPASIIRYSIHRIELNVKYKLLLSLALLGNCIAQAQTAPAPVASPKAAQKAAALKSAINLPPEKREAVRITRFETPPVIDGQLDDEAWKGAAVFKDFQQIQPGDNIPPSRNTEAMLGYDAKFLYIAFRAVDEPGKVRATISRRDAVFEDDNVGMFLDTFNDQRRAYEFFFNPLGVQADAIFTESGGEDFSVDIVMESKGVMTETGYTVEVAVPFKSLRYEAGRDKLWGIHLFRRIKRFNNELSSWMPISRDNSSALNQAGRITGLEGISTERTIEVIPSLTLSETGKRVRALPPRVSPNDPVALADPGRFSNSPIAFDPGVSAKFSITPTVTLDLTLNPDFAQVEADQTVVTANQRFPIFFPEKRPFFLEGIDIFQTPITALNTRAIVDPDYAAKLTGKLGRNTFGLLLASDNAPGNYSEEERADPDLRPDIEKFLDKNALIGVLRLKRDVGRESNIGLIATTYNFIERHNSLGGFDGRFRLNPKTVLTFQALGTTSRRSFFDPERDEDIYRTGNAFAYSYNLDYTSRRFGFFLGGEGRTRDYRADVGFTQRTNTNSQQLFLRFSNEPRPKEKLVFWRVISVNNIDFDWQGRMQEARQGGRVILGLQRETYVGAGYNLKRERLFEEEFGAKRTPTRPNQGAFFGDSERSTLGKGVFGFVETTPSKKYSADVSVGYNWNAFDFDFGGGRRFPRVSPAGLLDPDAPLDPGPGNTMEVSARFKHQPTAALRTSLDYTKTRLVRTDTGRVAFDDNIFSLRSTYQFTRFTFVRARVDYSTLASNARGQFLFGWTPNPGTSFYVGYNDDLNRNGFNPFTDQLEPGFRRNGRTFFIKMSYLFRRSF